MIDAALAKLSHRTSLIIILLACLLGYSNSLTNGFMLDDYLVLFGEKGILGKSFLSLFSADQNTFYRPVGHIFMWLTSFIFGKNYVVYHLANLVLFYAICVMVYIIVDMLFKEKQLSLLTALLYSLHPINGMHVNYITATVISFFVIYMELSFIFFLLSLGKKKGIYTGLSIFFFICALFSHEASIALPLFVLSVLYFLKEMTITQSLRKGLLYILVALAYYFFRQHFFSLKHVVANTGYVAKTSFVHYLATLGDLGGWYVSKLILPTDILFIWNGVIPAHFVVMQALGVLGVVGMTAYFLFGRFKKGLKAFSLAIFAAGFLPMAFASFTYFPYVDPIIECHWFYFSSLGFFILLAFGLLALKSRINGKLWAGVVAAILLVSLFLTRDYNTRWKDQETFCRYWISLNSRNLTPYYELGHVLIEKGNFKEAVEYLHKGLTAVRYSNVFVMADLGFAYFSLGNNTEAEKWFGGALGADSSYSLTHYYLGHYFEKKGDLRQAESAYQSAIALNPKAAVYYKALSSLLESQKRFSDALAITRMAVSVFPSEPFFQSNLQKLSGKE